MHQRQAAHKQISALSYYAHERRRLFTTMWGGEERGGKKRHQLKEEKANLFLKGKRKMLKASKHFVICDYFFPTLSLRGFLQSYT